MSSRSDLPVGILSWDFASPKGGMGVSLRRVADQLRAADMKVGVLSPSPDEGRPFLRFTRQSGGHLLFSMLLPFALGRALRRMRPRLLLLPVGPGGVLLLRRPKASVVAIVYHTYLQQARAVPGQRWKNIFLPLERRTLRMARNVICYCESTRRVLAEEFGLDNVLLLPHAVAARETAPRKREGGVVCVARLEARKGVNVLLEAWPGVRARVPHARLTIVGRGGGAAETDAAIAGLEGVERVGDLPRAALDALVAEAEVAACPAYLEGFGLAAAEAMAAGAVVVASDVDGLRDLIGHGQTGLLVPPGDAAALADAIVRALSDTALRVRLAGAARERIVARHDPEASARALVDAVSSLT